MATTTHIVFVDDLDGSTDGVEAVWFGLGDDLYEIDLSPTHRQQLRASADRREALSRSGLEQARGSDRRWGC